jgi:hypothetical protein
VHDEGEAGGGGGRDDQWRPKRADSKLNRYSSLISYFPPTKGGVAEGEGAVEKCDSFRARCAAAVDDPNGEAYSNEQTPSRL